MKSKCPVCGVTFEKGDLFCVKCGARLIKPVSLTVYLTCIRCGSLVEEGACQACGKEIVVCEICKKAIKLGDVVSKCKYCNRMFHHTHLRETVKVFGKCPVCTYKLNDEDIYIKVLEKENRISPMPAVSNL